MENNQPKKTISKLTAATVALSVCAVIQTAGAATQALDSELLPPNAKPGECYARVWVDAEYQANAEKVLIREASKAVEIVPATYETIEEQVLVNPASSRLELVPAEFETKAETVEVSAGQRIWKAGVDKAAAPVNTAMLDIVTATGIDLAAAEVGACYYEHYLPAQFTTETEQVLIKDASETIEIIPAEYKMVEETVLVKEASTSLVGTPAVYETVEESIIDKPAHTVWKKGSGPVQRLDESTGEIMCLVEVPATYKTVKKTVIKSPPTTQVVEIPAEYQTINVEKAVTEAKERRTQVPAEYATVSKQVKTADAVFEWRAEADPKNTRTGNTICLTETKPVTETVSHNVLKTPASTKTVEIPAKYQTVQVTKLVTAATEKVTDIPAEYDEIQKSQVVKDGYMEWRSILCDTNMTRDRIAKIQQSLKTAGYKIGVVDGVIGAGTIKAMNAFQKDNDLPVDRYLNIETVNALGVAPN